MDDFEKDLQFVVQDKYDGDASLVTKEDKARLAAGDPLAYVIGWIPFLGLRIYLDTPSLTQPTIRPLIPRPETEWWTERLITHLHERFGAVSNALPFTLLDLCAGSGAIGLAVLKAFPNAHVYFGELMPEHCALIQRNIEANDLDSTRATILQSDLFNSFESGVHFDIIATNPPYIPDTRTLELSVINYEHREALYSGPDGMTIISRIAHQATKHLASGGEVWVECDISNAEATRKLFADSGETSSTELLNDPYKRPRLVVAYF